MMQVTLWGTRGSLAAPGIETTRYGGNTSCIQVIGEQGTQLVLDAGTGIRRLGMDMPRSLRRADILLTHLHLDHIQGLGFFGPLDDPDYEVHIWGPASTEYDLRTRLTRYLSPPLFPIHLRDLPSTQVLHDLSHATFSIGEFTITSAPVTHPGPTLGYRITCGGKTMAYIPDHEPALGVRKFPLSGDWTSGYDLASDVDLLIHDAQFNSREYSRRIGWGHSSLEHAVEFARLARVKRLLFFHHDPSHNDNVLESLAAETTAQLNPRFSAAPAMEGNTLVLE